MDIAFALLHCNNTARKRFALPETFTVKKVESRILKIGKPYSPIAVLPTPNMLQYKSSAPLTIYSGGIEKVIAVYYIDFLDKKQYRSIISSAIANSNFLKGSKKHRFLDKSQKKSPLNRVTVILIFAKQVEASFRDDLFKTVCQNSEDGVDTAKIPCVVDLEKQFATFDSLRFPYAGLQYPVKNRGIRIVRKCLFNGKLTFADSPDMVDPIKDMDPEQSLWNFWSTMKKELILVEKDTKKRIEKMKHKELAFEDGYLYLKWEERGVWLSVEIEGETKIAEIDAINSWYYPKSNKISKETIKELKMIISSYFTELGYTSKFRSND
ncbi:MAG: hypothetical protein IJX80_10120 [Clostridia bacterium]|nr:hypothetical protein [Clostridia bacterium]